MVPHGGCPRQALPEPELWDQLHPVWPPGIPFKLLAGLDHAPPLDHCVPPTERALHYVNIICQTSTAIHETIGTTPIQTLAVIQNQLSVIAPYNAGATHSCLDYHVYHCLPPECKPLLHPSMLHFHKATSDLPFPKAGACDIEIHLEGCPVHHCVHIIFGLDQDKLLGRDFWRWRSLLVDLTLTSLYWAF